MSIESLLAAGARGQLLPGWSVVHAARRNDTGVVIGVYAGATVLSLLLSVLVMSSPGARIVLELFLWAGWAAIAYFFIAVGTKLSRGMATWGIALVAGIIAAFNAISALIGLFTVNTTNRLLDDTGFEVPGTGTFVVLLLLETALVAVAIYCLVKLYRGSQLIDAAAFPGGPAPYPFPGQQHPYPGPGQSAPYPGHGAPHPHQGPPAPNPGQQPW